MSVPRPMFPILNDPIIKCIPWDVIAPHEKQAHANHSQTLRGLAGRGGLSIHEAYYIIIDQPFPFSRFPKKTEAREADYRAALMRLLRDFEKAKQEGEADAS